MNFAFRTIKFESNLFINQAYTWKVKLVNLNEIMNYVSFHILYATWYQYYAKYDGKVFPFQSMLYYINWFQLKNQKKKKNDGVTKYQHVMRLYSLERNYDELNALNPTCDVE